MSLEIIEKYSPHAAVVKLGSSYDWIGRYSKSEILSLLESIPSEEIYLASIPHKEGGKAIMAKDPNVEDPIWSLLCPVLDRTKTKGDQEC